MQKIDIPKNKNFEKLFYNLLLIVLGLFYLCLTFLSQCLNKDFFMKYSLDKQLETSTIERIISLQQGLLGIATICILIIFILILFKEKIQLFIKKHKALIQNILLLIFTIIFLILLGEFILKIMINTETSNAGPGVIEFNSKYVFLNNEGMRDKNFSLEKEENEYRIIVLGDSFTYGWGLKDINNSYPKLIEKGLNENNQIKKVTVYNFGVPGKESDDELVILKEKGVKYKPDLLIIGYVLNDFRNYESNISSDKIEQKTIFPIKFFLKRYSYLYYFLETRRNKFLENIGLKESYSNDLIDYVKSDLNKEKNKEIFKEFAQLSKKNDFKVMIVIFPMLYDFKSYPFYELHDFVKEIGTENNFDIIDLFDIYKEYNEKSLWINEYDAHPNELGNKLAAEEILKIIEEKNIIK